ncbi:MAG: hypothetical protein H6861_02280 [Rhodospirillales bacterium]|nr:hypothetical protein [Rhodospirillales bacterium]
MLGSNNLNWKAVRLAGVTLSVQPKPRTPYSVLKVAGLVDTGNGQQTVILQNALPNEWEIDLENQAKSSKGLALPRRIANLNCIYTGKSFGVIADVTDAVRAVTRNAKLAAIVPEVVAPGDFMIFKHEGPRFRMRFAGMLRAVPQMR